MDCCVNHPYITISTLGGMREPRVPDAATTAVANFGSYPARSISGTAMRPMAANVAMLDPDAAANPALAKFDATARPPGKKANHLLPTLNSDTISPPLLASAPMTMNMGMDVSDQLAVKVYVMSRSE